MRLFFFMLLDTLLCLGSVGRSLWDGFTDIEIRLEFSPSLLIIRSVGLIDFPLLTLLAIWFIMVSLISLVFSSRLILIASLWLSVSLLFIYSLVPLIISLSTSISASRWRDFSFSDDSSIVFFFFILRSSDFTSYNYLSASIRAESRSSTSYVFWSTILTLSYILSFTVSRLLLMLLISSSRITLSWRTLFSFISSFEYFYSCTFSVSLTVSLSF